MSLKNCPFCGANEAWVWPYMATTKGIEYVAVRCKVCRMGNSGYRTVKEAEEAWNRREQ